MKMYVLDLGKILMETDNPVTTPGEAPMIPIHAFLLETPAGKILFDTGCHPDAMQGAWPPELTKNPYVTDGALLARLREIGVSPEEIDTVVLSHLHVDHAGGVHLFPNAQVYVQEQELRQTMDAYVHHACDLFHQPCDIENWISADVHWRPIGNRGESVIAPGVTILDLGPGHSFGMLVLRVDLTCGCFLLCSDAVYSRTHYGPPAQMAGVVYDKEGYFQSIEQIRQYAADCHGTPLFGHDMAQFQALMQSGECPSTARGRKREGFAVFH